MIQTQSIFFIVIFTMFQEGFSQILFESDHHHQQLNYTKRRGYSSGQDSFDWRTQGVVSDPKNQGSCVAGWAFAIIGAIEGQYARQNGNLLEFSAQELVDCSQCCDCAGCSELDTVMYNLQDLGGVMEDSDYPYVGKNQQCRYKQVLSRVTVTSHQIYSTLNDAQLKRILEQKGPLVISIDDTVLDTYKGGILNVCLHKNENHTILLVGYGTENGQDYWIIKNSKGTLWGENGYARVANILNCICVECNVMTVTVQKVLKS